MITRPAKLQPGDRVAILGASSASGMTAEEIEKNVRSMDLEPVLYESATARHGNLAGTDYVRSRDINLAFADDSIKGIIAIQGGYGFQRVLPLLDWEMIKAHPKFFGGFSDVTAMLVPLNNCGMESYHMPMPSNWIEADEFSRSKIRSILFDDVTTYENPEGYPRKTLVGGKAEGPLAGGNLSMLTSSMGTPYEIQTEGKILFIEDVHEATYRIDRMLTQMRNAGLIQKANGIVFGTFTDCEEPDPARNLTLAQILEEIVVPLGKPCFLGLQCGHCRPTLTLPMGRMVCIDADACEMVEK